MNNNEFDEQEYVYSLKPVKNDITLQYYDMRDISGRETVETYTLWGIMTGTYFRRIKDDEIVESVEEWNEHIKRFTIGLHLCKRCGEVVSYVMYDGGVIAVDSLHKYTCG